MLLDGQMCKCNRVTHFNGEEEEGGSAAACVHACVQLGKNNFEVGALRSMNMKDVNE